MPRSGRLKTRIDLLKKKIAGKGASLDPAGRRRLHKRLKRLQRSRRVAAALEGRGKEKTKDTGESGASATPPAA